MGTLTIVGIVAGAIVLLTVILLTMYVKAPPSYAYILSYISSYEISVYS